MLVPRRCPSPYGALAARLAAVGYLSPDDLGLDGSNGFSANDQYDSELFDASGYNSIFWIIGTSGAAPGDQIEAEYHYLSPFLSVNPAPAYQFTALITLFPTGPGPEAATWGTLGESPSVGFHKDKGFFVGSLHMSFLLVASEIFPRAHAFFCCTPEPACGGPSRRR